MRVEPATPKCKFHSIHRDREKNNTEEHCALGATTRVFGIVNTLHSAHTVNALKCFTLCIRTFCFYLFRFHSTSLPVRFFLLSVRHGYGLASDLFFVSCTRSDNGNKI